MRSFGKSNKEVNLGLDRSMTSTISNVPDGEIGNLATVKMMKKIAREKSGNNIVRQLAIRILNTAKTKSHNHLDEAVAIGEWVKDHMAYMKDPHDIELLQDPLLMIEKIEKGEARGDCDDMSLLTATLLLAVGIKPYFKIVRWKETSGNYNHIYVMVCEKNYREEPCWIALDCIIKDKPMGFELPSKSSNLIEV